MGSKTVMGRIAIVKAKSENLGFLRYFFISEWEIVIKEGCFRQFLFDRRKQVLLFERKFLGIKLTSREIKFSDINDVTLRDKNHAYLLRVPIKSNSDSGISGTIEIRLTYGFNMISRFINNRFNKLVAKEHKVEALVNELCGAINQMVQGGGRNEFELSKITKESTSPQDMSYYVMIRETIHGLDNLIVKVIYQSVAIITGALTLGVGLLPVIQDPWGRVFLGIVTISAFILTLNSQRRIKLYSDLLVQNVEVAETLENALLSDDSITITQRIEKNVKHAGMEGEKIFLRGVKVLYAIEFALFVCVVLSFIFYWEILG